VLNFDESYPNKPPTVKFLSKMFHPNVYANGELCLDILQNRWSPTYDVAAILTSIQSLLHDPNPNSYVFPSPPVVVCVSLREWLALLARTFGTDPSCPSVAPSTFYPLFIVAVHPSLSFQLDPIPTTCSLAVPRTPRQHNCIETTTKSMSKEFERRSR
jgi:hypothetical protein